MVAFFLFLFILTFSEKGKIYKVIKKYFIWIALLCVLANAVFYARWMPYWSPIDEGSHFAFVQFLSEKHKLPLLTDNSSEEVLALGDNIYPQKPKVSPKEAGLAGTIYEAFQPPLYYILSVPAYRLAGNNFVDKIYFLRYWGAFQLCIIIFFAYKAILNLKEIFGKKVEIFAMGAVALLGFTPAMIVRATTIGNAVMPIIFVTLVLWWMSRFFADKKREITEKDVLLLGIFTSLGLLSRFMVLFLIPLVGLFFLIKWKNFIYNTLVYGLIVLALLLPWFAFNKQHYGAYTANGVAKDTQMGIVNPTGKKYDMTYIKNGVNFFFLTIWLPEDNNLIKYKPEQSQKMLKEIDYINKIWIAGAFLMAILGLKILILNLIKKHKKDYKALVVYFLIIAGISGAYLQLAGATIVSDWPVMLGRYMHPVIVLIALAYIFLPSEVYKLQIFANRLKFIKDNKLAKTGVLVALSVAVFIILAIPFHINFVYVSHLIPVK